MRYICLRQMRYIKSQYIVLTFYATYPAKAGCYIVFMPAVDNMEEEILEEYKTDNDEGQKQIIVFLL